MLKLIPLPSQWDGAAHIQEGCPPHLVALEVLSQACPEVCLLGESKSCQVDNNYQLPEGGTPAPKVKKLLLFTLGRLQSMSR